MNRAIGITNVIFCFILLFFLSCAKVEEEEGPFKVSFESNEGSEVVAQEILKGKKAVEPKEPTKANSVFAGWYKDNNIFKEKFDFSSEFITADVTLYAKWDRRTSNQHLLRFDSNGGSEVVAQKVLKGEKAVEPKDPTKANNVFAGWYKDNSTFKNKFDFSSELINANKTLYAKWDRRISTKYLLRFDSNGGAKVVAQQISNGEKAVEPKEPTKANSVFLGWYKDNATFRNNFDFSRELITADITLYAKWERRMSNKHLLSFNSNGGANVVAQQISNGEKAVEPKDPTKANSVFLGWYKDNATFKNKFNFSTEFITADITLHAKWERRTSNQHLLSFDSNGGSKVVAQKVLHAEKAVEPKEPTKVNNVFAGWYKDNSTFNNKFDFSRELITANRTLYAKWDRRVSSKHLLRFDSNGGSNVVAQQISHREKAIEPKNPTKTNSVFAGWYKDDTTFRSKFDFSSELITADRTLYAKWEPKHLISFDSHGGSSVSSLRVLHGEKAVEPKNPTKANSVFAGWYKDDTTFRSKFDFSSELITGDIILYAKWDRKVNRHWINFETNGGSAVRGYYVNSGSRLVKPFPPTKRNSTFVGWYDSNTDSARKFDFANTTVNANTTIYAQYATHDIDNVKFDIQQVADFNDDTDSAYAYIGFRDRTTHPAVDSYEVHTAFEDGVGMYPTTSLKGFQIHDSKTNKIRLKKLIPSRMGLPIDKYRFYFVVIAKNAHGRIIKVSRKDYVYVAVTSGTNILSLSFIDLAYPQERPLFVIVDMQATIKMRCPDPSWEAGAVGVQPDNRYFGIAYSYNHRVYDNFDLAYNTDKNRVLHTTRMQKSRKVLICNKGGGAPDHYSLQIAAHSGNPDGLIFKRFRSWVFIALGNGTEAGLKISRDCDKERKDCEKLGSSSANCSTQKEQCEKDVKANMTNKFDYNAVKARRSTSHLTKDNFRFKVLTLFYPPKS